MQYKSGNPILAQLLEDLPSDSYVKSLFGVGHKDILGPLEGDVIHHHGESLAITSGRVTPAIMPRHKPPHVTEA